MPLLSLPALSRRAFGLTLAGAGVTVLRAETPSMHWALLSDTHISVDPADTYRGFRPTDNMKKALPGVLAAKPDGALICGDIARLKGLAEDYAAIKTLTEPLRAAMPLALVMGNHDQRANLLAAFGAEQKGAQSVKDRVILVVESPFARFITLDSNVQPNTTPGFLGKAQRGWLDGFLKSASKLPTILFVHHTLDDDDGALIDAPRLFDIIKDQRQVKAIVYGHSHAYAFDTWQGIHLVNLPSLGFSFRADQPVGWVDARFDAQGATFSLHAIGGSLERDGQATRLAWRG
jgi:3',5'-cyclic AMP phosphodiesterase CpdA